MNRFLPTTPEEVRERNWDAVDVLLVSGDAYVDPPAFGAALIGRVLAAAGYRVAILAQPDWRSKEPFLAFGRPRLFVGISAGCLDSMLAHYTASGNRRKGDAYSPGGAQRVAGTDRSGTAAALSAASFAEMAWDFLRPADFAALQEAMVCVAGTTGPPAPIQPLMPALTL